MQQSCVAKLPNTSLHLLRYMAYKKRIWKCVGLAHVHIRLSYSSPYPTSPLLCRHQPQQLLSLSWAAVLSVYLAAQVAKNFKPRDLFLHLLNRMFVMESQCMHTHPFSFHCLYPDIANCFWTWEVMGETDYSCESNLKLTHPTPTASTANAKQIVNDNKWKGSVL